MAVKDLVDKRKDILFAEIGALIHDLGKLSKEFVEGKDDYEEKDNDNVNKFRHEKIYVNLNFLAQQFNNNQFLKKLLELILKKQPLKRFNDLKGKINSPNKNMYSANDFPQWAKNDSNLKNLGTISKSDLDNFIKILSNNTVFLKYYYMSGQYFILPNSLLEQLYSIQIENWPMVLLSLQHHRNDKKAFGFDNTNLPEKMKLILAPDGADGIDSAIDKMVTNNVIAKQSKNHTYISTAFSYENQKIDLTLQDTDEKSLTKIRNDYANKLATILNNLKNLQNNPQDIQKWIEKREELLRETKKAFLYALGETRRPANDVTLWDHSFSVASLYKSALAEVIVKGWKEPKEIKWKLLGVRFHGNDFYNAVPKIADVLGRKFLVQKILDNIKILLEVIIPIGNEIYRDENGSVFLVPESCEDDNKILEITDLWDSIKDIELEANLDYMGNWNKKAIESIASAHSSIKALIEKLSSSMSEGLFIPQIKLSEPSRGALNLGHTISGFHKHDIELHKLEEKWQGKEEGYEKCTVCNLKPVPLTPEEYENLKNKRWEDLTEEEKNSVKAYERKECLDCLKLSTNRVEEWYKNKKWDRENPEKPSFDTTIWLDEVADENNRIGLIYIRFDLEKWLNGEMLNTFMSKSLLEGEFKTEETKNINTYSDLIELLKEAFDKNNFDYQFSLTKENGDNLTVRGLFKALGCYIQNDSSPQDLFKDLVENTDPEWKENYPVSEGATEGDYHKAAVFLLFMTRKHPSFARLRRIWETTKNFGIEMFNTVKEMFGEKKRTVFEFNNSFNLKITHTYYFKDNNDNKGEMVVLDNNKFSVISSSKGLKLKNGDLLEIYSDKYFNEFIGNLAINNFSEKPFKPIIPYQFEPANTMFFVPLKDKTGEIINEMKKQYEIQFNKVQDKLPLRLGFVAFHKRTPMYAVLDTAKRLMSQKMAIGDPLEVCNITEMDSQKNCQLYEGKIGNIVKEIEFNNMETYHFSYSTADPNKEDLFHSYFIVQNNNGWKVPVNGEWKTIKHVKHLKKGDKVEFYPSSFDFIYLDTNTRRLDVGKDRKHWLFKGRSPKPYRLKQIEAFNQLKELLLDRLNLTASQLLNAYGMLIDKLQNWGIDKTDTLPIEDKTFNGFVESVILSNLFRLKIKEETKKGQITQQDFEFLKNTILNGVFFDFIDMWHTILKRKFKEDENV